MLQYRTSNALSLRHKDENGFLTVDKSPILRSGILEYYGSELLPEGEDKVDGVKVDNDKIYKVFIPLEELKKAKDTFKLIPILNDHTWMGADGEDPKKYQEGTTGENITIEDDMLYAPLKFTGKKIIDALENKGKRELSSSYYNRFEKADSPDYDFVARDIKGNHLALVDKGRCGSKVRVLNADVTGVNNMEWNEKDHPRDDAGRFTDKGGEGSKNDKYEDFINSREVKEHLAKSIEAQLADNPNAKIGDTIIDSDDLISRYGEKLSVEDYDNWNSEEAEDRLFKKLNEMEKERGFKDHDVQSLYDRERSDYLESEDFANFKKYNTGSDRATAALQYRNTKMTDWSKYEMKDTLEDVQKDIDEFQKGDLSDFDKEHIKKLAREKVEHEWLTEQAKSNNEIPHESGNPNESGGKRSYNQKGTETMADKEEEKKAEGKDEVSAVENEDKRKLIDEIGGILKGKVDEEVWKTVMSKLEKVAYNPSETSKSDDKCKSKNSDDPKEDEEKEDEKEDAKEAKSQNYDAIVAKVSNAMKAEAEKKQAALVKAYNACAKVLGDFNPFGLSDKDMYVKALNHMSVELDGEESVEELSAMLKACNSIQSKVDNSFNYGSIAKEEIETNW